ncbi:MAG: hypothetical protein ACI9C4_003135 [Paraglaciecola sp.]
MGYLFFSEQPDATTFNIAEGKGLSLVINFRHPAERRWDENNSAKKAGMTNSAIEARAKRYLDEQRLY